MPPPFATTPLRFADGQVRATRAWDPTPKGRLARGRFLLIHGMESHSGWFDDVGRELAARGFAAAAFDRLGWGESAGRRGDAPSATALQRELQGAVDALCQRGEPCHLVGLSWGGLLAMRVRVASLTLIAPALFPVKRLRWCDYAGVAASALGWTGQVSLPLKVNDFTQLIDKQKFIEGDRQRITQVSARFLLATWQLQRYARTHQALCPVRSLLLAGADTMIDNQRTQAFAAAQGFNVHVREGAAHSLVLEDPSWVAGKLIDTAQQAESRPCP